MSVAMLMQSPLATGLFARAIIQSGPGLFSTNALSGGTPLSEGEKRGVQFAEAKGAASLAELRALTPEQLLAPSDGAVLIEGVDLYREDDDGQIRRVRQGVQAQPGRTDL